MARASVKENKSLYQTLREEQGWTRDVASIHLQAITPERIERIESGKLTAHPDEVVLMADKYKAPQLCNYFCTHECEIGKTYVPELQVKDLSQIVLEMLASLNAVKKNQERLIEITADGVVERNEIEDFVEIQDQLEKISITVETLKLWSDQMVASGKIDPIAYKAAKEKQKNEK